jgi:hypothetical protein
MARHQSIVGFSTNRAEADFYPTPPSTTEALFKVEKFDGLVWECASGNGSMSKVIEKYNQCISSDIRTDTSVYGTKGIDFLKAKLFADNIITNPPYRDAQKFVEHALKLADKKVAMLLKLVFLESSARYQLFKSSPLKIVYVFCKRQTIYKEGIVGVNAGLIAYAWFVWDKNYTGKPTIDWIKD